MTDDDRTGCDITILFDFGADLSDYFLAYASSNNLNPESFALACYYVLLFKLTNGEDDLCIGFEIDNRWKDELKPIIGMFVNTIPLRCRFDFHCSFDELTEYVQKTMTETLQYSYFPLQRILTQHPNSTNLGFLNTSFHLDRIEFQSSNDHTMIGDNRYSRIDFMNKSKNDLYTNQLWCTINASLDVFKMETIDIIAQRFHSLLHQLFHHITDDQKKQSLYKMSLGLSALKSPK